MGFTFSLAAVLSVRRQREEAAERSLSNALRQLSEARQTVDRLDLELKAIAADHRAAANQLFDGLSLHERYARISLLQRGRAEMLVEIEHLERQRDLQQDLFRIALQERKMLSELESRQRQRFQAEQARQEQRRNDDLYLARRLRR